MEEYLEKLGLSPKFCGRYWSIKCPHHNDRKPSAQCFKDGWIHCLAGCESFHINQLCREHGDSPLMPNTNSPQTRVEALQGLSKLKDVSTIVRGDFTSLWVDLEPLPSDFSIKGVPASELNKRGWRRWQWESNRRGVFIPYFDAKKQGVPFYQIRFLEGEVRFNFAKGITPICYGLEQLKYCKRYLPFTEGSRDSVILGMAGVPAIALPSASSDKLLDGLCNYCNEHHLFLVCIGDRDSAGDKLLSKLTSPAIDRRTPVGKDVGDFYQEKGLEAVRKYYSPFATL